MTTISPFHLASQASSSCQNFAARSNYDNNILLLDTSTSSKQNFVCSLSNSIIASSLSALSLEFTTTAGTSAMTEEEEEENPSKMMMFDNFDDFSDEEEEEEDDDDDNNDNNKAKKEEDDDDFSNEATSFIMSECQRYMIVSSHRSVSLFDNILQHRVDLDLKANTNNKNNSKSTSVYRVYIDKSSSLVAAGFSNGNCLLWQLLKDNQIQNISNKNNQNMNAADFYKQKIQLRQILGSSSSQSNNNNNNNNIGKVLSVTVIAGIVITSTSCGKVYLYLASTGDCVEVLTDHQANSAIFSVSSFIPASTQNIQHQQQNQQLPPLLATAGQDSSVIIYDCSNIYLFLREFSQFQQQLMTIVMKMIEAEPEETQNSSGEQENENLEKEESPQEFEDRKRKDFLREYFSNNKRKLCQRKAQLYEHRKDSCVFHCCFSSSESCSSSSISSNQQQKLLLASCSQDKTISVVDCNNNWKRISTLKGHAEAVSCCSFHPTDSNILVSGSDDGLIMIWNVQKQQRMSVVEGDAGVVNSIQVFIPKTHHQLQEINLQQQQEDFQIAAAFSEGKVLFFDVSPNSRLQATITGHSSKVSCVVFSEEDENNNKNNSTRFLATGDVSGRCIIFDLKTWKRILMFEPFFIEELSTNSSSHLQQQQSLTNNNNNNLQRAIEFMDFSPDLSMFAVSNRTGEIVVFEIILPITEKRQQQNNNVVEFKRKFLISQNQFGFQTNMIVDLAFQDREDEQQQQQEQSSNSFVLSATYSSSSSSNNNLVAFFSCQRETNERLIFTS